MTASTATVFCKPYHTATEAQRAAANLRWLTALHAVRLPTLRTSPPLHLVVDFLPGAPPTPADLPSVAGALGRLHTAAHRALTGARLDCDHHTGAGHVLPAFTRGREAVMPLLPAGVLTRPAVIYKDANLRNFLIDAAGEVAVVDFDDLTLAPPGYDLAKLVVSAAMTHGRTAVTNSAGLLAAYNAEAAVAEPALACRTADLVAFCEAHHLLTAAYLGRNGYIHPWPTVRPWPAPAPARRAGGGR